MAGTARVYGPDAMVRTGGLVREGSLVVVAYRIGEDSISTAFVYIWMWQALIAEKGCDRVYEVLGD